MEDQFGGRTDDDLFADDFEPVNSETRLVGDTPPSQPDAVPPPASQTEKTPASRPARPPRARKGLAASRYNDKEQAVDTARDAPPAPAPSKNETDPVLQSAPNGPSASADSARSQKGPGRVLGQNTALRSEERIKSGGNPRTKLTDEELSERLEKMRIINAEKTRKFEQAEADERTHAEAYARGMEAARKRKQAEEERRKRGEEERRRMDDERARNRERKLRAMEQKDDGWDQGKQDAQMEEKEFRGAHGGVRGARAVEYLGGRYGRAGDGGGGGGAAADRPQGEERFRGGRGRGRGRGGRGVAGNGTPRGAAAAAASASPAKAAFTTDDFPALPSSDAPPSPDLLVGTTNWGEEMEALDAQMAKKS